MESWLLTFNICDIANPCSGERAYHVSSYQMVYDVALLHDFPLAVRTVDRSKANLCIDALQCLAINERA